MIRRLIQTFLNWDRNPFFGLGWRLVLTLAVLRPWAFTFTPVALDLGSLEPAVLQAARQVGLDVNSSAGWVTHGGIVFGLLLAACAWSIAWWGLGVAAQALIRRQGPGLPPFLLLLGGAAGMLLGLLPLLSTHLLPHSSGFFQPRLPVYGGWLTHPLLQNGGFTTPLLWIGLLGLLGLEMALVARIARVVFRELKDAALRTGLSPHFLYNTFNTLASDIELDPQSAVALTHRLASLLERVTSVVRHAQIPLREELLLVEDYLSLVRRRMGERLQVSFDIPEAYLEREVPVLGLQVLVENAIGHALAPRVEGGSLEIRAWTERGLLWVGVTDSGDGQSRSGRGQGLALQNLKARLANPRHLRMQVLPQGYQVAFAVR